VTNIDEWDQQREDAAETVTKANEAPLGTLADLNDGVTTVYGLDAHQFHPWGRNT
jgi:hypothetical protein